MSMNYEKQTTFKTAVPLSKTLPFQSASQPNLSQNNFQLQSKKRKAEDEATNARKQQRRKTEFIANLRVQIEKSKKEMVAKIREEREMARKKREEAQRTKLEVQRQERRKTILCPTKKEPQSNALDKVKSIPTKTSNQKELKISSSQQLKTQKVPLGISTHSNISDHLKLKVSNTSHTEQKPNSRSMKTVSEKGIVHSGVHIRPRTIPVSPKLQTKIRAERWLEKENLEAHMR